MRTAGPTRLEGAAAGSHASISFWPRSWRSTIPFCSGSSARRSHGVKGVGRPSPTIQPFTPKFAERLRRHPADTTRSPRRDRHCLDVDVEGRAVAARCHRGQDLVPLPAPTTRTLCRASRASQGRCRARGSCELHREPQGEGPDLSWMRQRGEDDRPPSVSGGTRGHGRHQRAATAVASGCVKPDWPHRAQLNWPHLLHLRTSSGTYGSGVAA